MTHPFKDAIKSIRRSPNQAIAAFLITFVTWLMLFIFGFIIHIGNRVLRYYESQPRLIVFFQTDVTNDQAQEKFTTLQNHPELTALISNMTLITKDQALEIYRQNYNDEALLNELLTPEIFPASIEISTHRPQDMSTIKNSLSQISGVDEITYQEDVVETFLRWTNTLRLVGVIFVLIFLLLTFFVTKIIIGMKVVSRRHSIEIMKILGAKKGFIRAPYLWEAFIYGTISCLSAWGVIILLLHLSSSQLQSFFQPIPILPMTWKFSLITLGTGLILSLFLSGSAAWTAVSRILKRR